MASNVFAATPETVSEYSSIFVHYDKEKKGILDYHEFKHMLRALGYEIPLECDHLSDAEFQRILDIVDPQRNGHVTKTSYINFMIQEDSN